MATDPEFAQYVRDCLELPIEYKKMFGEYGFYCQGKFFAIAADNQFFVKTTAPGREFLESLGSVSEQPPYPGAKNYFEVGELLEDSEQLSRLVELTIEALPRKKRTKKK